MEIDQISVEYKFQKYNRIFTDNQEKMKKYFNISDHIFGWLLKDEDIWYLNYKINIMSIIL